MSTRGPNGHKTHVFHADFQPVGLQLHFCVRSHALKTPLRVLQGQTQTQDVERIIQTLQAQDTPSEMFHTTRAFFHSQGTLAELWRTKHCKGGVAAELRGRCCRCSATAGTTPHRHAARCSPRPMLYDPVASIWKIVWKIYRRSAPQKRSK